MTMFQQVSQKNLKVCPLRRTAGEPPDFPTLAAWVPVVFKPLTSGERALCPEKR